MTAQILTRDRFWSKVDIRDPSDCWPWLAYKSKRGYGKFKLCGRQQRAHRVAWEAHNGRIPDGMCVLHSCDNPSCVNPSHLFIGTHNDNMQDMVIKNRSGSCENNGNAKLTNDQVSEIRERLSRGETPLGLTSEYAIGYSQLSRIANGSQWN